MVWKDLSKLFVSQVAKFFFVFFLLYQAIRVNNSDEVFIVESIHETPFLPTNSPPNNYYMPNLVDFLFSLFGRDSINSWNNGLTSPERLYEYNSRLFTDIGIILFGGVLVSIVIIFIIASSGRLSKKVFVRIFKGKLLFLIFYILSIIYVLRRKEAQEPVIYDAFQFRIYEDNPAYRIFMVFLLIAFSIRLLSRYASMYKSPKDVNQDDILDFPEAETDITIDMQAEQLDNPVVFDLEQLLYSLKYSLSDLFGYYIVLSVLFNLPNSAELLVFAIITMDLNVVAFYTFFILFYYFILETLIRGIICIKRFKVEEEYEFLYVVDNSKLRSNIGNAFFILLIFLFLLTLYIFIMVSFYGSRRDFGLFINPNYLNFTNVNAQIGEGDNILGTDYLGRDILSRLLISNFSYFGAIFFGLIFRGLLISGINSYWHILSRFQGLFNHLSTIPKFPTLIVLITLVRLSHSVVIFYIIATMLFTSEAFNRYVILSPDSTETKRPLLFTNYAGLLFYLVLSVCLEMLIIGLLLQNPLTTDNVIFFGEVVNVVLFSREITVVSYILAYYPVLLLLPLYLKSKLE